jgi:hypothetical protein
VVRFRIQENNTGIRQMYSAGEITVHLIMKKAGKADHKKDDTRDENIKCTVYAKLQCIPDNAESRQSRPQERRYQRREYQSMH